MTHLGSDIRGTDLLDSFVLLLLQTFQFHLQQNVSYQHQKNIIYCVNMVSVLVLKKYLICEQFESYVVNQKQKYRGATMHDLLHFIDV